MQPELRAYLEAMTANMEAAEQRAIARAAATLDGKTDRTREALDNKIDKTLEVTDPLWP